MSRAVRRAGTTPPPRSRRVGGGPKARPWSGGASGPSGPLQAVAETTLHKIGAGGAGHRSWKSGSEPPDVRRPRRSPGGDPVFAGQTGADHLVADHRWNRPDADPSGKSVVDRRLLALRHDRPGRAAEFGHGGEGRRRPAAPRRGGAVPAAGLCRPTRSVRARWLPAGRCTPGVAMCSGPRGVGRAQQRGKDLERRVRLLDRSCRPFSSRRRHCEGRVHSGDEHREGLGDGRRPAETNAGLDGIKRLPIGPRRPTMNEPRTGQLPRASHGRGGANATEPGIIGVAGPRPRRHVVWSK